MNETCDVLDSEQIEMLRSLDDGEGAVLGEIITEFLSLIVPVRDELLQVLSDRDGEALGRAAHTLKGASANVGAAALADVCARLEVLAQETRLDDAPALMEHLEAELARVLPALQGELSRA